MEVKLICTLGIIFLILSPMIFAIDIESEIKINKKLIREKEYDELVVDLKRILKDEDIDDAEKIYESAVISLLQQFDYEKALDIIELFLNKYPNSKESEFFYEEYGYRLKRIYKLQKAISPLKKSIELSEISFMKRFQKQLISEIYYIYNEYDKSREIFTMDIIRYRFTI